MMGQIFIPSGKLFHLTMENHHVLAGYINYFYGHFNNSFLYVYQRLNPCGNDHPTQSMAGWFHLELQKFAFLKEMQAMIPADKIWLTLTTYCLRCISHPNISKFVVVMQTCFLLVSIWLLLLGGNSEHCSFHQVVQVASFTVKYSW